MDASYQVSNHLAKRLEENIFKNRQFRNKNWLWQPCLLMNQNEMSNLYRVLSIDASYQVSYHFGQAGTEIWWEAPMEGSVLSFLKAEWKVSDTGSAHWASSFALFFKLQILHLITVELYIYCREINHIIIFLFKTRFLLI
jgi:hypothetical protein